MRRPRRPCSTWCTSSPSLFRVQLLCSFFAWVCFFLNWRDCRNSPPMLQTQLQYLNNDLDAYAKVFAEWKGRKNFPRFVPFPAELFGEEEDLTVWRELSRPPTPLL